jgi:DNA-binding response OmpR family regulator
MDGWEVCRHLREYSSIPIILLTAKGEEFDKLRFRLGVDDYVTKPFSLPSSARIELFCLARHGERWAAVISGDLTVDLTSAGDGCRKTHRPHTHRIPPARTAHRANSIVPVEHLLRRSGD